MTQSDVVIGLSEYGAQLIQAPKGMVIEIRDYNVPLDWDESNTACKTDADGERYQEILFTGQHAPYSTVQCSDCQHPWDWHYTANSGKMQGCSSEACRCTGFFHIWQDGE